MRKFFFFFPFLFHRQEINYWRKSGNKNIFNSWSDVVSVSLDGCLKSLTNYLPSLMAGRGDREIPGLLSMLIKVSTQND